MSATPFFADVGQSGLFGILLWVLPEAVGQRLKACLNGDLSARSALRLIGQVEIFQLGFIEGAVNRLTEFWRQFALFFNGAKDRLAAGFKLTQIDQPGFQLTELGIVQTSGDFLTVAGDKGNGVAFIQKVNGG